MSSLVQLFCNTINTPVDYAAEFKKQKHLPRRQVESLKPGAQVEVKWSDGPNSVCIILSNDVTRDYDDGLRVMCASAFRPDISIDREQVVSVMNKHHVIHVLENAMSLILELEEEIRRLKGKAPMDTDSVS